MWPATLVIARNRPPRGVELPFFADPGSGAALMIARAIIRLVGHPRFSILTVRPHGSGIVCRRYAASRAAYQAACT